MWKGIRPLIFTAVLVMTVVAIFFSWRPEPSSAQDAPLSKQKAPFKTYTLGVYCGSPESPSQGFVYKVQEELAFGNKDICVGKCGGGMVSLADALAPFPADVGAAFNAQVAQYQADAAAGKAKPLPCLRDGKDKSPEGKKPKCEPPPKAPGPPWLNPDVPCEERTTATVSWTYPPRTRDIAYKVSICGEVIPFVTRGFAFSGDNRSAGARSFEVCCVSWKRATDSKVPCDPRGDIDCDGVINEADLFPDIPTDQRHGTDYYVYTGKPERTVNEGRFFDALHPPDQSECEYCKWALVSYQSSCQEVPNIIASRRTGSQIFDAKHRVNATWRCPINGNTKVTDETLILDYIGCPPKPAVPGFVP